jgi:hypothetical protein
VGSSLRRQLREALPASVKGLQRAIALEIADDARYDDAGRYDPESGRCSRVRLSELARWTGAKDELTVREMLRRMGLAGWEFRVPIGQGKDGRPLFAVPGRAMQFRVPDFTPPSKAGGELGEGMKGPTVVVEGPTVVEQDPTDVAEGPTPVGPEPTTVGPPSPVLLSSSPKDPSSSPAGLFETEPAAVPEVQEGGGGGDFDLRSIATHITASLDYQGQMPDKQQQEKITAALVAALAAGWSVEGLAVYLSLGSYRPDNPAAFYLAKLTTRLPDTVPAAAPQQPAVDRPFGTGRDTADGGMWERAMARANQRMGGGPRPGTDTTVAGWGDVARQLRTEHKPYSNDTWSQPADPAEAAKIPHCGHWECDPDTRLRPGPTPQDKPDPCSVCHPAFRF